MAFVYLRSWTNELGIGRPGPAQPITPHPFAKMNFSKTFFFAKRNFQCDERWSFLNNLLDCFFTLMIIDVFLSKISQEHVRIDVKPKSFLSREVIIFCGPDCRTLTQVVSPPHKKTTNNGRSVQLQVPRNRNWNSLEQNGCFIFGYRPTKFYIAYKDHHPQKM